MSTIDLGPCFYCQKPVIAAQGQAIKYLVRTHKRTGERKEFPTHAPCRKGVGKNT